MTKQSHRVDFDEFAAHLPALFDVMAHDDEAVLVEKDGRLYRLEATEEIDSGPGTRHDPERLRSMLTRTAGSFKGIDRTGLMKDIRAGREQAGKARPA